jgi:DnaK suppressor protein
MEPYQSVRKESSPVPYTPETARAFVDKLLQQRAVIERAMRSAVEQGREASVSDIQDAADLAVASYQREMLFSQGTSQHIQLQMIQQALDRIEDGEFGQCQHCGKEIGRKRLEALPWTPYCIECQEKIENGQIEPIIRAA